MVTIFFFSFMIITRLKWYVFLLSFLMFLLNFNFFSFNSYIMSLLVFVLLLVTTMMTLSMNKKISLMIKFTLLFSFFLFNTMNLFIFFIMFELMVILMSFMIVMYGTSYNKISSMLYLFFYTMGFSLLFIGGIFLIFWSLGSFSIYVSKLESISNPLISLSLLMVLLVKLPLMFVHIWLPRAHVDSPVVGSMVLAGIMLKIGCYGIIILLNQIDFLYFYLSDFVWWWSFLSALLMVYFCFIEHDFKKIIAYSSVSHMSLMSMSIMSLSEIGLMSSVMIMVSHGMTSPAMFWSMGKIYMSNKTRNFNMLGGSNLSSYYLSWFMMISLLLNMGFPPFINFFGELLFLKMMLLKSQLFLLFMVKIIVLFGSFNIYNNSKLNFDSISNSLIGEKSDNFMEFVQFTYMFMFLLFLSFKLWLF